MLSEYGSFSVFLCISTCTSILVFYWIPETKGLDWYSISIDLSTRFCGEGVMVQSSSALAGQEALSATGTIDTGRLKFVETDESHCESFDSNSSAGNERIGTNRGHMSYHKLEALSPLHAL